MAEACPEALPIYRRYIEAWNAPRLTLQVGGRVVNLELFEPGVKNRRVRSRNAEVEAKASKKTEAPAVELDF